MQAYNRSSFVIIISVLLRLAEALAKAGNQLSYAPEKTSYDAFLA